jgi:hypothetical protein
MYLQTFASGGKRTPKIPDRPLITASNATAHASLVTQGGAEFVRRTVFSRAKLARYIFN